MSPAPPIPLEEIAHTLEAPLELLPEMPWLLRDLPSLGGGGIGDVLAMLRRAGFARGGSVLDLGCGRGELALAFARAFEARVLGIDAFPPFVDRARRKASAAGLGRRCRFVLGDLRDALRKERGHDAVAMVALGPVLGDVAATIRAMRATVRPGGLIVFDDGYLAEGVAPPPGYEGHVGLDATEAGLRACGDDILERRERTPAMRAYDAITLERIGGRARRLLRRRPELRRLVEAYLTRQEREIAVLAGPLVPAVWLLRRVEA